MASAVIHLAIAKKYLKQHKSLNDEEVIKGTLYPDAMVNSIELHYPKSPIISKYAIGVYNKVDLFAFLEEHPILNDFELGWFLHLVTDYLFFLECFTNDYLKSINVEEFCKELYHSYDCLDSYLFTKYHITKEDFKDYPSEYYPGIPYEDCILSKELVDHFIERVSSIDLDAYIVKIKENKLNAIVNIFEGKEIRSIWDSEVEDYYFSVVDVIEALTNSNIPKRYWSDLKRRLNDEGSQVYANIVRLKMKASDGKFRETDTLNTKGIFRLIESVPSPNAEPFKVWLASLGSERIDEVFDPEIAIKRAIQYYRSRGDDDSWIEARLKGILDRNKLTDVWQENGIT